MNKEDKPVLSPEEKQSLMRGRMEYGYSAKWFSSDELSRAGLSDMRNVADLIKSAPTSYYEAIAKLVEDALCGFIPTLDGTTDNVGSMESLAGYHDFLVFEAGETYQPVDKTEEEWYAADNKAYDDWCDQYPQERKPMSDRELLHHGYFGLED